MAITSLKDAMALGLSKIEEMRQNAQKHIYLAHCDKHGDVAHSDKHGCLVCKTESDKLIHAKSLKGQWLFRAPEQYEHAKINNYIAVSDSQIAIKQFIVSLLKDNFAKLKEAMNDKLTVTVSGTVGVGKTHLAVAMCQYIWEQTTQNVVYSLVTDMFNEIKATYKYKDDSETQKIIKKYAYADILVLDELGLKPLTDHEAELLYNVLNARYSNKSKRFTMVITNLNQNDLNKWYQERVASRMQGLYLEVIADDYRKSQAESLQNKWLAQ